MDKKTFAIDCDEVLRALVKNMISLYNKEFGENLSYEDVKDFMVDVSFPKILATTGITGSQWFFQDHSTELFLNSESLPKAKEAIEILKKFGDVIIVTYQKTYINKMQTLSWLESQGILPNGICFLKNKTLIHPDYFIDDNDWNFVGCNAEHGVLISAPYNLDVNLNDLLTKTNCKTLKRYDSLYDFAINFKNNKI